MGIVARLSRHMALGVSALLLTTAAQAETLTIYWNAGHAYEAYAEVIKGFEADNPGWTVQWERYQWPEMRTKLVADFSVKNAPDLVSGQGPWISEFGGQGLLMPLDDYIAADGKTIGYPDDWYDFSVERNMYDGKYYGIQMHLTCVALVYNVDMLKDAGFDAPPTTWDEFMNVARATTKNGKFGFVPNQVPMYHWPWIFQNGGDYYDPATNKVTYDSDAAIEAVQFLADMIHKDQVAPLPVAGVDYEGPQKLFTAGRAAMILTGPWDVGPIKTGNPNLNWDVAPGLTNERQMTVAGGVGLMIPASAKHPDQAWELIKRFTSLETELVASVENGMTMPRKSWGEQEATQADPVLNKFGQCLPYSREVTALLDPTGKTARVEEMFKSAMEDILYNNKPARDVLTQSAAEANAYLAN
ncbi:sugar ABC transporter substrate-binding protein [Devosia sp.]|uniref:ABC transporter substrate-binding protein n=1 Tax=Devosia sp. TaxID=1871048 RepID=UPI002AFFC24F|nr:sugar ABC transporter substrate-binding protein [Devosia sp.]